MKLSDVKRKIYGKKLVENAREITDKKIVKIIIFNECRGIFFHNYNKKFISNIFKENEFILKTDNMNFPIDSYISEYIQNEIKNYTDDIIYIFNASDYYIFIHSIPKIISENLLLKFLTKINYIFINYEVINSLNLSQIGNYINSDISQMFYNNANLCILCNDKNISYYLHKNKKIIKNNIIYFPPLSYSKINGFIPLEKYEKDIDILFYGNLHHSFSHRENIINKINTFCTEKKYNFLVKNGDLLEKEKDEILKRTKIVIHIPSHENLHTIPWAKIGELMCKKVFFIVEKSIEIYTRMTFYKFPEMIITYSNFQIEDLFINLEKYLNNENLRNENIEKCFKFISTNYNADIFYKNIIKNGLMFKKNNNKKLNFLSYDDALINTFKYYINCQEFLLNIFRKENFNIEPIYINTKYMYDVKKQDYKIINKKVFSPFSLFLFHKNIFHNPNNLYIFNELDFHFLMCNYNKEKYKEYISNFFKKNNYIIIFSELFVSEELDIIGSPIKNREFVIDFFINAKKCIVCDTNNIKFLNKNKIINNIHYCPALGYSEINKTIPIESKKNKNIDILFYGNFQKNSDNYRNEMIIKLQNFSKNNNYNLIISDNIYEIKNEILLNTKIVLHIPIFKNQRSFPWAKISEIMCKKIFFLIEENEEIYLRNISDIIAFYNSNNLFDKIKYYLENENEREKYITKCYNYIKENHNIDKVIKNLI